MSFLTRSAGNDATVAENFLQQTPLAGPERINWEVDQTPEALYARINEISTLFTEGKYTKDLAVQRLLDLLYDIDQSENIAFNAQTKSRYYLLIFNCICRIRNTRRLVDILRRKVVASDQMMYLTGIDFSDLSLPGLHLENALFKGCNFSSASLHGLRANSCQFIQCRFGSSNLTQAVIIGSSFEGVTLTGSNLSFAKISKSSFVGCDFSEIISSRGQRPLRVNGCNLVACSFREADLKGADFRNTRMTGCDTLDAKKQDAKGLV